MVFSLCCFGRFAIMCGIMTDYDTMQNKIRNGYIFKVLSGGGGVVLLVRAVDHSSDCTSGACVSASAE